MSKLPTLRTRYGENIGVEILCAFPELQDDQRTFLDADASAGDSTLTANGINFSVGQYIMIGQPGALKTEIIRIHASTTPTSTLITLASALKFPHNRGDVVRFIPYNAIWIDVSTDGGSTYSFLATTTIRADSTDTYYQNAAGSSTDYYRIKFENSSDTTFSSYSDGIPATGYADNTIGSVKRRALRELGEEVGDLFKDSDLNDWLQQGRRQMDQMPQVYRFTFRTKFNTIIGQCISGNWTVSAPTDLRDRNTFKNILGIKFGRQNRPCVYQDRVRFNQNYLNVAQSTLNGVVAGGATTITLTSSHDFDDSGSVVVASPSVGGSRVTLTYTANNRSTNVLSGVSGVPAIAGFITGLNVWQNANFFGLPTAYTIDAGLIQFDVPFYDQLDGRNIVMDYYSTVPAITTDSQTFDEPFYDEYVSWLKWKIKYKKANGKINRDTDTDYKDWMEGVAKVIAQETNGQQISMIPDIEGFLSAMQ
ncbi:MAG: hypothetical protein V4481_05290 [Patescibacteria group bacterium]